MSARPASIRPAAVAGAFYPRDGERLRAEVGALIDRCAGESCAETAAPPKILIVPHAGYQYSGEVAACAYRLLAPHRGRVRRVVLIGPSHRVAFRGVALPSVGAFWTPLGAVALQDTAALETAGHPALHVADEPHAWEHALEVQLPFLQATLEAFELVPLVVGDASPRDVAEVLDSLWGGEETVVVVSSDLSHYHEHALASQIDSATVKSVLALEARLDHEQACGATAINAALLCARRRGLRPQLLDLRNSGDTAGPRDRVVGYCSIAFFEQEGNDADRTA